MVVAIIIMIISILSIITITELAVPIFQTSNNNGCLGLFMFSPPIVCSPTTFVSLLTTNSEQRF